MAETLMALGEEMPVKKTVRSVDDRMLGVMAAFAVTWGLLCLIMFALSFLPDADDLARQYNPEQVAYLQATPGWVMFSKAMSAIGVLCGAVYLLLRKQSAYHWFMISLVGTLLTMVDSIFCFGTCLGV